MVRPVTARVGFCRQVGVRHKIRTGIMLRKNKKQGTAGAELLRKGVKIDRNPSDLDSSNT